MLSSQLQSLEKKIQELFLLQQALQIKLEHEYTLNPHQDQTHFFDQELSHEIDKLAQTIHLELSKLNNENISVEHKTQLDKHRLSLINIVLSHVDQFNKLNTQYINSSSKLAWKELLISFVKTFNILPTEQKEISTPEALPRLYNRAGKYALESIGSKSNDKMTPDDEQLYKLALEYAIIAKQYLSFWNNNISKNHKNLEESHNNSTYLKALKKLLLRWQDQYNQKMTMMSANDWHFFRIQMHNCYMLIHGGPENKNISDKQLKLCKKLIIKMYKMQLDFKQQNEQQNLKFDPQLKQQALNYYPRITPNQHPIIPVINNDCLECFLLDTAFFDARTLFSLNRSEEADTILDHFLNLAEKMGRDSLKYSAKIYHADFLVLKAIIYHESNQEKALEYYQQAKAIYETKDNYDFNPNTSDFYIKATQSIESISLAKNFLDGMSIWRSNLQPKPKDCTLSTHSATHPTLGS